jgi:hypothetical protein
MQRLKLKATESCHMTCRVRPSTDAIRGMIITMHIVDGSGKKTGGIDCKHRVCVFDTYRTLCRKVDRSMLLPYCASLTRVHIEHTKELDWTSQN